MADRHPQLTGVLADIASATDVATALKIADVFGGRRLYVAAAPKRGNELVKAVGADSARAIAGFCGGMTIDVPIANVYRRHQRNTEIIRQSLIGVSAAKLARFFGLTERSVYNVRRKHRTRDERQAHLFDEE